MAGSPGQVLGAWASTKQGFGPTGSGSGGPYLYTVKGRHPTARTGTQVCTGPEQLVQPLWVSLRTRPAKASLFQGIFEGGEEEYGQEVDRLWKPVLGASVGQWPRSQL